jgi:hypothetical protein
MCVSVNPSTVNDDSWILDRYRRRGGHTNWVCYRWTSRLQVQRRRPHCSTARDLNNKTWSTSFIVAVTCASGACVRYCIVKQPWRHTCREGRANFCQSVGRSSPLPPAQILFSCKPTRRAVLAGGPALTPNIPRVAVYSASKARMMLCGSTPRLRRMQSMAIWHRMEMQHRHGV